MGVCVLSFADFQNNSLLRILQLLESWRESPRQFCERSVCTELKQMETRLFQKNDSRQLQQLLSFVEENPWKPVHSLAQISRFVTELISDDALIFDVHDQRGRLGTAVLLDKVNNPSNDACLEIFGLRADVDQKAALKFLIELAKQKTPDKHAGFQLGFAEGAKIDESFLRSLMLFHHYDTFEMLKENFSGPLPKISDEISEATFEHQDLLYKTLCESFAQTLDTSIPEFETWRKGFSLTPQSRYFLKRGQNEIQGFAHLLLTADNAEAEIRTLGVLPSVRGRGLGEQLLNHALHAAQTAGATSCHLSVAVTNHRALNLYQRVGFQVVEKYLCYRFKRAS